ncbi:hypothetical protein FHW84_000555 [Dyella sp. SG562]|uniref:PilZ domain-containing protein n=1 Tax=Dyella sp. SG562 TaxID=2587017 RepID=UPI00141DC8F5|nr:hypothetical protein [Dyella sp. SG562]
MNTPASAIEQRRAQRKRANYTVAVTDVINDRPLGHLGNLSATGLLLIGPETPRSEAVYQVSLGLPGLSFPGTSAAALSIELGIQEQWHDDAATPGQVWSGFRIVSISPADAALLEAWLALPGGTD